jgi:hypothetical protein
MNPEEALAYRSALARATNACDELARAKYVIGLLRTPVDCKPWVVDEDDAEYFLQYFRDRAAGMGENTRRFRADVVAFCDYYNIDLGWLLHGDPGTMICEAAARSKRAATT